MVELTVSILSFPGVPRFGWRSPRGLYILQYLRYHDAILTDQEPNCFIVGPICYRTSNQIHWMLPCVINYVHYLRSYNAYPSQRTNYLIDDDFKFY